MNQLDRIFSLFQTHFDKPTLMARAPGRINIIGEHTDYTGGFVFPAAIGQSMYFAASEGRTPMMRVIAADLDQQVALDPKGHNTPDARWQRYFAALIDILREKGHRISAVDMVFGGDIPTGSGLSSSAALSCGFLTAVNGLFNLDLSLKTRAFIAQEAEHRVGVHCGIMDMFASLHGRAHQALVLDCASLDYQYYPVETGEYQFFLFHTNVQHALGDTPYNERRASCETVWKAAQEAYPDVERLRDLEPHQLPPLAGAASAVDLSRVAFVLAENRRVLEAARALQNGELAQLGALLYASHAGLRDVYQVSCPELDFCVDFMVQNPGVLGARMVGGGFGGCTLNLLPISEGPAILAALEGAYFKKFGKKGLTLPVVIGDGAALVG